MHHLPCSIPRADRLLRAGMLFASLCSAPVAGAYAESWLLIPEAPVTVVRGTSVFQADAPLAVQPDDLVATDSQHGAQLQSGDGTIAALGPQTRLAVSFSAAGNGAAALDLSVLGGWVKVSNTAANPTAKAAHAAPSSVTVDTASLHVVLNEGSMVMRVSDQASALFVENGNVSLTLADLPASPLTLGSDHFVLREPGQALTQSTRPTSAFVSGLPVNFRDPLAPLAAGVPLKAVTPEAGHPATYADIADWLNCRLPVRPTFVPRFRTLIRSAPFRSDLRSHLRTLPEWRPVLYPPPPAHLHRGSGARPSAEVS